MGAAGMIGCAGVANGAATSFGMEKLAAGAGVGAANSIAAGKAGISGGLASGALGAAGAGTAGEPKSWSLLNPSCKEAAGAAGF
jgi:hypothetical protein